MNKRGAIKYFIRKYRFNQPKLNCTIYFLYKYYKPFEENFTSYKFGINDKDVDELYKKYCYVCPRRFEDQGFTEDELFMLNDIGDFIKAHHEFVLINQIRRDLNYEDFNDTVKK